MKSCWFQSLALSSLGVEVEGSLAPTDTPRTVILKMVEANRDYCLANSPETENHSDGRAGRQGWGIFKFTIMKIVISITVKILDSPGSQVAVPGGGAAALPGSDSQHCLPPDLQRDWATELQIFPGE